MNFKYKFRLSELRKIIELARWQEKHWFENYKTHRDWQYTQAKLDQAEKEIARLEQELYNHRYHYNDCQSTNHINCYGILWRCEECGKTVCEAEGCADDYPNICDDCYAFKKESLDGPNILDVD